MFKLIVFIAGSAGILALSWKSLRDLSSHGFYRFFAFEIILIMFLLNLEIWFNDPFSIPQIISWLLLLSSLFLALHGFYLLRVVGKPKGDIEKTTVLVTKGAYKYIRHPLYSSLLFLAWGIFFKDISFLGLILALASTAFLAATAKVEEAENIKKFGDSYAEYIKKTKMFVPYLF